ncbi:MAG: hypothetical protein BWX98_01278 [Candidatus Aminicenantes bacterium ADurb.Bin147]|nr:MAG: hypothetical protein BWX98_01278 [Candidatus Aminicenantes bacterium ADurb.Bin147]
MRPIFLDMKTANPYTGAMLTTGVSSAAAARSFYYGFYFGR